MADAEATLTIGPTHVALKRAGRSELVTARILGRETTQGGEHIWLDRVIHRGDSETLDEWQAQGAMVTELFRAEL